MAELMKPEERSIMARLRQKGKPKQVSEMSDAELAAHQEPGVEEEDWMESAQKLLSMGQETPSLAAVNPMGMSKLMRKGAPVAKAINYASKASQPERMALKAERMALDMSKPEHRKRLEEIDQLLSSISSPQVTP